MMKKGIADFKRIAAVMLILAIAVGTGFLIGVARIQVVTALEAMLRDLVLFALAMSFGWAVLWGSRTK
jgi:hypothetical protein